jgi:NAD(P) transhydrogenase subunit alpha
MEKSFNHAFAKPWASQPSRRKNQGVYMEMFLMSFTVFVLAIFVGFEVITKIPPTLHTPLMSGSNAISGITLVGAIVSAGTELWITTVLGFLSVVLATINVIGGFMVTNRMLAMFKKKS